MPSRTSIVTPIYKSVVRAIVDFIEELNDDGSFGLITYHDWESRGEEENLPTNTLLGLDGWSFDENLGRWIIRFSLALSSYRDTNLLNEIDLLDRLHLRFGEKQKIALLEMTGGDEIAELMISVFQLLPMGQSQWRNYRSIGIELMRTSSATP